MGRNKYGLSSTGFNSSTYDFKDQSKHSVSHKYGSSSIIKNHPCCDVKMCLKFKFQGFLVAKPDQGFVQKSKRIDSQGIRATLTCVMGKDGFRTRSWMEIECRLTIESIYHEENQSIETLFC